MVSVQEVGTAAEAGAASAGISVMEFQRRVDEASKVMEEVIDFMLGAFVENLEVNRVQPWAYSSTVLSVLNDTADWPDLPNRKRLFELVKRDMWP